jgi:chemotaxis protein methyltransferase CheR
MRTDVRIIAATNRKLEEEVKNGRFREDLWYRLNVFPITMPPLRQRQEDIALLVRFFVQKISKKLGKKIKRIPTGTLRALENYSWPGNVRELENVIERAVINSQSTVLKLADNLKKPQEQSLAKDQRKPLDELERDYIIEILEETKGRIYGLKGAAKILGINPETLRYRIRKLGINPHSYRS